jgi:adenylate cyclase class 2
MSTEIEAKMRVGDLAGIESRLKSLGARRISRVEEVNVFFDTIDRRLVARDEGLRVRASRDLGTGQTRIVATHKGAQQSAKLKTREETELTVDSLDGAIALLRKLGFVDELRFEKRRTSYELDECRIELDQLPLLGTFVEIEGATESRILAVREKLELQRELLITTSYIAMLMDEVRARHLSRTEPVSFENHPER